MIINSISYTFKADILHDFVSFYKNFNSDTFYNNGFKS